MRLPPGGCFQSWSRVSAILIRCQVNINLHVILVLTHKDLVLVMLIFRVFNKDLVLVIPGERVFNKDLVLVVLVLRS